MPVSAASNGRWSVFPTTLLGQTPHAYLQPVLDPGKPLKAAVTVSNFTTAPLNFNLYAADAINTAGGGLSLRPSNQPQRDIGRWIQLPYAGLTVPARSATVVPFTILAPSDASPGDHVGGIVAEETQGTTSKSGSFPITVLQAVGVRIYARVVGALHASLDIPRITLSTSSTAATEFDGKVLADVRFGVRNSGNTVLSPVVKVALTTPFGTAARRAFTINQFLPGSSLAYSLRFPDTGTFGHLHASVSAGRLECSRRALRIRLGLSRGRLWLCCSW